MEKQKELAKLKEYNKAIATDISESGTMYVGFEDFCDVEYSAEVVGGEIYLLKKRNGEHQYRVLGRQHKPYDRLREYEDSEYSAYTYAERHDIYNNHFKERLVEYAERGQLADLEDCLDDYKEVDNLIDEMNEDELIVISQYNSVELIERYPLTWYEDVYEYRIGLFVREE